MRPLGAGAGRLATPAIAAPRLALLVVGALVVGGAAGIPQLRFGDDLAALLRAPFAAAAPTAPGFADPADDALLMVEADFEQPERWRAFERLVHRLEVALGADRVSSILDVRAMARAAGPARDADALFGADGVGAAVMPTLTPAALAAHPLNAPPLLTGALDAALVRIAPAPSASRLASAREIRSAVAAATAELPADARTTLTGLPLLRLELVTTLARQQPWLLGVGLAIGFGLGVVLLGRWRDAVVVAVMPIVSILALYGVFAHAGVVVTPLVNNLPLLLLALAFTTSLHLVYATRIDLAARGHAFAALRGTMARVMPAVVLSMLTTALAFSTLVTAGSAALARFGALGAAAVCSLVLVAALVHPAVVWTALRLGWRPRPSDAAKGRRAHRIEAAGLAAARRFHARRRMLAAAAVAATVPAFLGFLAASPAFSFREDVRAGSTAAAAFTAVEQTFGVGAAVLLSLPVALDRSSRDPAALASLRAAHEAATAAFPRATVLSPWTLVDWLNTTGRAVTAERLDAVLAAAPASRRGVVLAADATTPALMLALATADTDAVAAAAGRLETTVGDALDAALAGRSTGFAVAAARGGPDLVADVARGLALAAVAASLLVAVAFRSVRVFAIALVPNVLPVLLVGATLVALDRPLRLASAMALTIALGIAVDGTVHLLNRFAPLAARRPPRAALARSLRELGPVLVISTAVLALGLVPALASWSLGVAVFAAVAIATLGFALIADLVVLPPLLALGAPRRHGPSSRRSAGPTRAANALSPLRDGGETPRW